MATELTIGVPSHAVWMLIGPRSVLRGRPGRVAPLADSRGARWTLRTAALTGLLLPVLAAVANPALPKAWPGPEEPTIASPLYWPAAAPLGPAVNAVYSMFVVCIAGGLIMLAGALPGALRIVRGKHVNAIFTKLALSGEQAIHRRVAAVLTFLRDAGLRPPA